MTIPAPPLPRLRDLIGGVVHRPFSERRWLNGSSMKHARTYRMGRDALAAAVYAMLRRSTASRMTVWFPDYICNSALDGVRALPVDLMFYPIDRKSTRLNSSHRTIS